MNTCKFIKVGNTWTYRLSSSENKLLAVNENILTKVFGVSVYPPITVTVKDVKGQTLNVEIDKDIKSVSLSDNGIHVFADVDRFTIPLTDSKEPDHTVNNSPLILTSAWIDWRIKYYKDAAFSALESNQRAIQDGMSLAAKDRLNGLNPYSFNFGGTYVTTPGKKETILYYTVNVTGYKGEILVEPVKSLANEPNTLTAAWLVWKYQQLPESDKNKQSFKRIFLETQEEIAKTLPGYNDDSIVTSLFFNKNAHNFLSGHLDIQIVDIFK